MGGSAPVVDESLLSELERQEQYLAELPQDYSFPLFCGRQAIESQRKSGYKSTARAAREIVDNAYEAGAKRTFVVLQRLQDAKRKKRQRKDSVSAIAFIDDGPGMLPTMARYALSWGGGTHFKSPEGIGRFGFGLPNSSINQTRRVEVYSRATEGGDWYRVVLDIDEGNVPVHGLAEIPEPEPAELPQFVRDFLAKKELELSSGTVVVWMKPDRLTYRQASSLREHLVEDFGVVYRGMLDDFSIEVDGIDVKKVDPLFLTEDALLFKASEEGGARCTLERSLPVKYYRDGETGTQHLELISDEAELKAAREDPAVGSVGTIHVKIARFPKGFVLGEQKHRSTDEYKRFEIRKPRRGMSFVRSGREVETVDVFPKSASDEASGLGSWPLLQSYAYHWGISVSFKPQLDDAFGIGNDKQTVRPIEDFWRVLVKAEIDTALKQEEGFQRERRKKEKEEEAKEQAENPEQPNPATEAAAAANATIGRQKLPDGRQEEAKKRTQQEANERAQRSGRTVDEEMQALKEEAERKEYAIQFFDSEGGVFYKPSLGNGMQKVAMINTAHPFFKTSYAVVAGSPNSRARSAVDLRLLSLAQVEHHRISTLWRVPITSGAETQCQTILPLELGRLSRAGPVVPMH